MKLKKKLPVRYLSVLLPFALSMMMSGLIGFINTARLAGFSEGFLNKWLVGWMVSWAIAFPTVLVVLPVVKKLLSYIIDMPKEQ
ncbi:MAG: DUF2798 domain-containing protein [Alphaproteobacteria bacterium]|nr:DUF2798 domain-containing protein [Alphaproteobacteria bacterium]OJV46356.1 MAG: hypothetical protein BGO28_03265 [Alphaproteobacteria bacterium 43-37]